MIITYEIGYFEYVHSIKTFIYSFILKFVKDDAIFKHLKLFIITDETENLESIL